MIVHCKECGQAFEKNEGTGRAKFDRLDCCRMHEGREEYVMLVDLAQGGE